jgi:hypothetical protein
MSEWLRRQTWNLLGYARAGSNPAVDETIWFFLILSKPFSLQFWVFFLYFRSKSSLILVSNPFIINITGQRPTYTELHATQRDGLYHTICYLPHTKVTWFIMDKRIMQARFCFAFGSMPPPLFLNSYLFLC